MHSGMYIHFFSYHPLHVKRGVASSLFLRALRICDPQYLDEEIKFLRLSFMKLGYPSHFLDAALSRARRTFYQVSPPRETPQLPVLSLSYTEEVYSLRRPLHPLNCRLSFRQVNTIRHNLVRTSPSAPSKVGTYAIPCSSCDRQYFGETGASLSKRVSQHKYAISRGHSTNAHFCHQWDTGHQIDWSAARIVFPSADVHARRLVESSLINKLPNINLNSGFPLLIAVWLPTSLDCFRTQVIHLHSLQTHLTRPDLLFPMTCPHLSLSHRSTSFVFPYISVYLFLLFRPEDGAEFGPETVVSFLK